MLAAIGKSAGCSPRFVCLLEISTILLVDLLLVSLKLASFVCLVDIPFQIIANLSVFAWGAMGSLLRLVRVLRVEVNLRKTQIKHILVERRIRGPSWDEGLSHLVALVHHRQSCQAGGNFCVVDALTLIALCGHTLNLAVSADIVSIVGCVRA